MIGLRPIMNLDKCVTYLKNKCKNEYGLLPLSYGGYYCGITNDVDRRANEHNATILGVIEYTSADFAKELEAKMHDEGFDTGKQLGNGQDDSIYVYVYKKAIGVTKESLDN